MPVYQIEGKENVIVFHGQDYSRLHNFIIAYGVFKGFSESESNIQNKITVQPNAFKRNTILDTYN